MRKFVIPANAGNPVNAAILYESVALWIIGRLVKAGNDGGYEAPLYDDEILDTSAHHRRLQRILSADHI